MKHILPALIFGCLIFLASASIAAAFRPHPPPPTLNIGYELFLSQPDAAHRLFRGEHLFRLTVAESETDPEYLDVIALVEGVGVQQVHLDDRGAWIHVVPLK